MRNRMKSNEYYEILSILRNQEIRHTTTRAAQSSTEQRNVTRSSPSSPRYTMWHFLWLNVAVYRNLHVRLTGINRRQKERAQKQLQKEQEQKRMLEAQLQANQATVPRVRARLDAVAVENRTFVLGSKVCGRSRRSLLWHRQPGRSHRPSAVRVKVVHKNLI